MKSKLGTLHLTLVTSVMLLLFCSCKSVAMGSYSDFEKEPPVSKNKNTASSSLSDDVKAMVDNVIQYGEKFLGKPYGYRGPSKWRMDCSGYVSHLFSKFGVSLPHSSGSLSNISEPIKDPQPGDLLFFKGRNSRSSRVGHVAIVVENNNGRIVMMHSTNNRGIIKETLNNSEYFSKRYLHAGRLPQLNSLQKQSNGFDSKADINSKAFTQQPEDLFMPSIIPSFEKYSTTL